METVEAELGRQIREHVRVLVSEIGPRPPGSPANARANVDTLAATAEFVIDWLRSAT